MESYTLVNASTGPPTELDLDDARTQLLIETELALQLASKKREYEARAQALQRDFEAQLALKKWRGRIAPVPMPIFCDVEPGVQILEEDGVETSEIYNTKIYHLIVNAVRPRLEPKDRMLGYQLEKYERDIKLYSTHNASRTCLRRTR